MSSDQVWAKLLSGKITSPGDLLAVTGLSGVPVDLLAFARRLGLEVYHHDGFPRETSGLVEYDGFNSPRIFLNPSHSSTRQRFTLAHEIGHVMRHMTPGSPSAAFRDSNFTGNSQEAQANRFAADLLMPLPLLAEYAARYGADAERLAPVFGVSKAAMAIRLQALRLG